MVDPENILRPNLEQVIHELHEEFPRWKHVILTENTMWSIQDMFFKHPKIAPVFDMLLCEDNYFSRDAIRGFFRRKGYWWPFGRKIRKERAKRKKRRVNDIFLGKKVILIDDLRDGTVPEHSFCVTCKLWTGVAANEDEINWPFKLKENIMRILKKLYHYSPEKIA